MAKTPAFQFYPGDFLSDKNVLVMTTEEIGAYILLLSSCWLEGELPDDIEELSALARIPFERFQVSWERRLKRCFSVVENGVQNGVKKTHLVHPRLEEEKEKQEEWRRKSAKGGKKSAGKRKNPKSLSGEQGGSQMVATKPEPKGNQRATLQSSSSINKSIDKDTNVSSSNSSVKLVEEVFDYWREKFTHPKAKLDNKRKRKIEEALKSFSVADLKAVCDAAVNDPFHMGINDRNRRFDDVSVLFRDAAKIEGFLDDAERLKNNEVGTNGKQFKSRDERNRDNAAKTELVINRLRSLSQGGSGDGVHRDYAGLLPA